MNPGRSRATLWTRAESVTEALSIKRKKGAADEFSFEQLRRDGIAYAQQFSGRLWSDYNLHDPGVTILEQLCYALTDLIHRADLDVADYLANADGELDFEQLALHRPENIFPARPTTLADYRRAILKTVRELENLWLTPCSGAGASGNSRGLYHITLKLAHGVTQEQQAAVIEKVFRYYNSIRNLCEGIATITVVRDDDYELCAEIEVQSGRRPADMLAEIYFESAKAISGCRTDDAAKTLPELPIAINNDFLVSSLFSIINSIAGVDQIKSLHFEKQGRTYYDSISCRDPGMALNLFIPVHAEQIKIQLSTNGRRVPVSINELRARFDELEFSYHSSHRASSSETSQPLPRGVVRELEGYFSIQNQFPVTYGIGGHGIPDSAPSEVKARALQLKAYLLTFEQIMANYLANLGSIKQLFSIDKRRATYSGQPLNNSCVTDFDKLFSGDATGEINAIIAAFDNANDRKSRLLDYLLALYGESFPQHSLRHFNCYYNQNEVDEVIIDNKIAYLEAIVELGRDRAAAGDYSAPLASSQALSGLQRRVNLLLGFRQREERALTMALLKHDLKLMPHDLYQKYISTAGEESLLIELAAVDSESRESFERVPELDENSLPIDINRLHELIGNRLPLRQNPLSDLLLRSGIYLDNYRIGSLTAGTNYQLLFKVDDRRCWNLGTFSERSSAIEATHALRRFLIQINTESEGLHVVEHVLLKPQAGGVASHIAEDFYPFRISVLLPAWSARCHDPQFRMLAEETVNLNTPAHIHAQFYWLEFHKMYEFEILHENWLMLKHEYPPSQEALDAAATNLIDFLHRNRRDTTRVEDDHG